MDDAAPARNDSSSVSGGQTNSSAQSFDPAQDTSVPPPPADQTQPAAIPPVQDDVAAQPAPIAPAAKEQEPISSAPLEMPDLMQPTEQEPVLHPEVAEAGVQVVSQGPQLSVEDHRAGLAHSGDAIAHPAAPSGMVELPLTPEEAVHAAKNEPTTNSKKWLGALIVKHIMTLHKKLIGGSHA